MSGKTRGLHVEDVKDPRKEEFNSGFSGCSQIRKLQPTTSSDWAETGPEPSAGRWLFWRTHWAVADLFVAWRLGQPASCLKTARKVWSTNQPFHQNPNSPPYRWRDRRADRIHSQGRLSGRRRKCPSQWRTRSSSAFLKSRKSQRETKGRRTTPTYTHFAERCGRFDEHKLQHGGFGGTAGCVLDLKVSCNEHEHHKGIHAPLLPHCLAADLIFFCRSSRKVDAASRALTVILPVPWVVSPGVFLPSL